MTGLYKTGRLPQQTMLKGQYLVLDVIGKGGMGAVYLAMDTITRRRVAVKEMGTSFVTPDRLNEIYTRFAQEANILRRLNHPNLPRFYEYFHENGRSYIVMDYIEGETLAHLLAANSWQPLPVADVIRYAKQLCDVLNYLHTYHDEQGQLNPLLFCDLKPANIIVTAHGQIYLVDFGIARFFSDPAHDIMGTLGYSPPEQFYGHTTPRSDLYSLGATLYVCLTGHNPKNNVPTVFNFPPVRNLNHHVPVDMEALLRWLLATQEADRPESAARVLKTLQDIEHGAAAITTDFSSNPYGTGIGGIGANFYDDKTARAAQYHAWLIQVNKLPGTLGKLWATYIIPTLSRGYGVMVGFLLKMYGGKVLLDAFSQPVWTPHFWFIFLLSFLFSIGGSAYLINSLHTSPYAVAFFLASALMVLAFTSGMHKNITSPLSRNVLLAMSLMPLVLCASLLGLPAVQHTLQTTTLNQLICIVLIALGASTLLRPEGRFYWLDHVALAAIAVVIALQQTRFGLAVWQQLQPQGALASDGYNQYAVLLIAIPAVIGVLALLRLSHPLGRFSRIFLLVLAVLNLGLQLVLGKSEILPLLQGGIQAFQPSPELLYALLALGPSVLAFFSVFLPLKPSRLGNSALFVLACSLAYLQNQIGTHLSFGASHSYPLTTALPKLFSFYQLIAYGLVALAVILFLRLRLRTPFALIDYLAIFGVAVVATVLQSSVWFGHSLAGYRIGNNNASVTMLLIGLNEAMALVLVLLVVAFLIFTVLTIFFNLSYHAKVASSRTNKQSQFGIERFTGRIFHSMIVSVSVTCVLLLHSFGQREPVLVQPFTVWQVSLSGYEIVQWLLIAITVVAFIRLIALMNRYNSYGRTERLVMLVAALVCAFLLFGDQGGTYIALTPPSVSQSVLHALPFFPLIFLSTLATALLALIWLLNPWHQGDRGLLLLFFGGACICALFQFVQSTLLVVSLLLLIQGLVLATRMEQVR